MNRQSIIVLISLISFLFTPFVRSMGPTKRAAARVVKALKTAPSRMPGRVARPGLRPTFAGVVLPGGKTVVGGPVYPKAPEIPGRGFKADLMQTWGTPPEFEAGLPPRKLKIAQVPSATKKFFADQVREAFGQETMPGQPIETIEAGHLSQEIVPVRARPVPGEQPIGDTVVASWKLDGLSFITDMRRGTLITSVKRALMPIVRVQKAVQKVVVEYAPRVPLIEAVPGEIVPVAGPGGQIIPVGAQKLEELVVRATGGRLFTLPTTPEVQQVLTQARKAVIAFIKIAPEGELPSFVTWKLPVTRGVTAFRKLVREEFERELLAANPQLYKPTTQVTFTVMGDSSVVPQIFARQMRRPGVTLPPAQTPLLAPPPTVPLLPRGEAPRPPLAQPPAVRQLPPGAIPVRLVGEGQRPPIIKMPVVRQLPPGAPRIQIPRPTRVIPPLKEGPKLIGPPPVRPTGEVQRPPIITVPVTETPLPRGAVPDIGAPVPAVEPLREIRLEGVSAGEVAMPAQEDPSRTIKTPLGKPATRMAIPPLVEVPVVSPPYEPPIVAPPMERPPPRPLVEVPVVKPSYKHPVPPSPGVTVVSKAVQTEEPEIPHVPPRVIGAPPVPAPVTVPARGPTRSPRKFKRRKRRRRRVRRPKRPGKVPRQRIRRRRPPVSRVTRSPARLCGCNAAVGCGVC